MPEIDFFNFFRYLLAIIGTVYVTVVSIQSLRQIVASLSGTDRHLALIRRYLIVHGLRLRFRAFWGDVLVCLLLCVVFALIWRAHGIIFAISDTLRSTPTPTETATDAR
ncbi:MAG TPA: hypothetical protein VF796_27785 [Humisphaera sp.]